VKGTGRNATPIQLVDLIFHQGDERRDDQGDAGQDDRGELIAKGRPGAGRHDREHIVAAQDRRNERLLSWPERLVAEVHAQRRQQIACQITCRGHD
jgi:hypothetical protein